MFLQHAFKWLESANKRFQHPIDVLHTSCPPRSHPHCFGVTHLAPAAYCAYCALYPGAIDWQNAGSVLGVWKFGWYCFVNILFTLYNIVDYWGPL